MREKKATNGNGRSGAIIDAETVANLETLGAEATADELDAELIDAVKSENTEQAEGEKKDTENAAKTAMIIGMVESILKARWPFLQIDSGVKLEVFEKVQPVFEKYGEGFPDWLAPWKEEIELGIVLSIAGYGIHSQISAHAKKEENNNENPEETSHPHPSAANENLT